MKEKIDVYAYSGFRAYEKPIKFTYKGRDFEIKKILNRSINESTLSKERTYRFSVMCEDQRVFEIYYNIKEDQWFIKRSIETKNGKTGNKT